MIGLVIAACGASGVYLLYTALAFGAPEIRPRATERQRVRTWITKSGLDEVRPAEFASVMGLLFVAGAALAFAMFGGPLPTLVSGTFAATLPTASYRNRRDRQRRLARDA